MQEIASWVDSGNLPDKAREMMMVMIPKPGKDHGTVKDFRPIVLAQTVVNLSDKVI